MSIVKMPSLYNDVGIAFERLMDSCSFKKTHFYTEMLENRTDGEEILYYCDVGYFSDYIKECYKNNNESELKIIFKTIEDILTKASYRNEKVFSSGEVENFIIVGLIECLQNSIADEDPKLSSFNGYLGGMSINAWQDLIKHWNENT